tara:strand:- start:1738 stop:3108 length:1371 start_codon:yes stop_codon:yes gene_type:complete
MCGIVGVYGNEQASRLVFLGLHALQHRAQESTGIASFNGDIMHFKKGKGITRNFFNDKSLDKLPGRASIGQIRYSTEGGSALLANAQPYVVRLNGMRLAIGHNGDIISAPELRKEYEVEGSIFQTTSDTEIILHSFAKSKKSDLGDRLVDAFTSVREGACSVVMLINDALVGMRDVHGYRPLVLGKVNGVYVLASETCAFNIMGAEYLRVVEPGEIVMINKEGVKSIKPFESSKRAHCIFELAYFSRPDSTVYDIPSSVVREALGAKLREEDNVGGDVVISVPDSGNHAALGYSRESGIPLGFGFIRSHYGGRTFIAPFQKMREADVLKKLTANKHVVRNKKVIVVDDSIVRGTTVKKVTSMLRHAGALEVHWRIAFYPWSARCRYGIDTPSNDELAINRLGSVEGIRKELGADSLKFLGVEDVKDVVEKVAGENGCRLRRDDFCVACGNGEYLVK